jgi:putative tricarboxylic transport membrane protein
MIISDTGLMIFFSFEYQNKFSYAPIFLIIGLAVLVMRAVAPYLGKEKSNA